MSEDARAQYCTGRAWQQMGRLVLLAKAEKWRRSFANQEVSEVNKTAMQGAGRAGQGRESRCIAASASPSCSPSAGSSGTVPDEDPWRGGSRLLQVRRS